MGRLKDILENNAGPIQRYVLGHLAGFYTTETRSVYAYELKVIL